MKKFVFILCLMSSVFLSNADNDRAYDFYQNDDSKDCYTAGMFYYFSSDCKTKEISVTYIPEKISTQIKLYYSYKYINDLIPDEYYSKFEDNKGILLAKFILGNGEIVTLILDSIKIIEILDRWIMELDTSFASFDSEIEEIGTAWSEWQTMKYINSRFARHDITLITLGYVDYSTGDVTEFCDIDMSENDTADFFFCSFSDMSEKYGTSDFWTYAWE